MSTEDVAMRLVELCKGSEWKKAIDDPEILKRFRHFVNSDEPDRNVIFVAERGQIRPARPEEREVEAA